MAGIALPAVLPSARAARGLGSVDAASMPYEIKLLSGARSLPGFRWETLRVENGSAELTATLNKPDWVLTSPDAGVEVKKIEGANKWRVMIRQEASFAGFHVAAVGPLGEAEASAFYLEQRKPPVSTLPPVPKVARFVLSLTPGFQGGTISQSGSFGEVTGSLRQGAYLSLGGQYLINRDAIFRVNFASYQTTFAGKGLTYLSESAVSGTALDFSAQWKQVELGFYFRPQPFLLAQPQGVKVVLGSARSVKAGLRQTRALKFVRSAWMLQTAERVGYTIGGSAGQDFVLQSLKGFNVEVSLAMLRTIRRSASVNLAAGAEINGGWQSLKGRGEWTEDFNGNLDSSSLLYGARLVLNATF